MRQTYRSRFAAIAGAALISVTGALPATTAAAQTLAREGCPAPRPGVDCLSVLIDHVSLVSLPGAASVALVGNPGVADVTILAEDRAAVNARSVGGTNLIFLRNDGSVLREYAIVVREAEEQRVVLRRGPSQAAQYQCAPRCERTVSQMDDLEAHSTASAVVERELSSAAAAASFGAAGDAATANQTQSDDAAPAAQPAPTADPGSDGEGDLAQR